MFDAGLYQKARENNSSLVMQDVYQNFLNRTISSLDCDENIFSRIVMWERNLCAYVY